MSDKKFSEFTLQTSNSNVAFVVGFNGSDNVRISPSNLIGSGFLPTSGGTMTGNLLLQDNIQVQVGTGGDLKLYHNGTDSFIENQTGILKIQSSVVDGDISFLADNGSGTPTEYFKLDGSVADGTWTYTTWVDYGTINLGNNRDLQLYHNATDSHITNRTGDLYIKNQADDKDIIFQSDDGSGGTETYFFLDGSASSGNPFTVFPDLSELAFGTSRDLRIKHDGTDSSINNNTGDLYIKNSSDDKDIIFQSDDGSGGVTEYFKLWGLISSILISKDVLIGNDTAKLKFGASQDLQIYHDGSHSYIEDTGTGQLRLKSNSEIQFLSDTNDFHAKMVKDGAVELYHDNSKKFETTSTGVTVTGDVNLGDSSYLYIGASNDLQLIHDGTDSYIQNTQNSGDLVIQNGGNDKDVIFKCDDGSGGVTEYFKLDGSSKRLDIADSIPLCFGAGDDLQIQHNGTTSYIQNYTGNLIIENNLDDGDIIFKSDNGSGGTTAYLTLDGSAEKILMHKSTVFSGGGMDYGVDGTGADVIFYGDTSGRDMKWDQSENHLLFKDNTKLKLGTSGDTQIYSDNSNSIFDFFNLSNVLFRQHFLDGDITFQSDDGSGGVTTYFKLDGGTVKSVFSKPAQFIDNTKLFIGSSNDLQIYHDATNSNIVNETGDLLIEQKANDGDIKFYSDDGSGNVAQYFRLDGGSVTTQFLKTVKLYDNVALWLGDNNDLQIYHDGSNSYIKDAGTGFLIIQADAALVLQNAGGEPYLQAISNGAVQLYHDNSKKFETTSSGVDVTGRMAINDGNNNVSIGDSAGDALTGNSNVAIGHQALTTEVAGDRSVAIGLNALRYQTNASTTDVYNVAIGYEAGTNVTTGTQNTILGGLAGDALTTGGSNIAIGVLALSAEDTGSRAVAIGYGALENQNYNGSSYNTAIGYDAGKSVTTAIQSTIVGANAGDNLTTGSYNTVFGYNALSEEDTHGGNTAIGRRALMTQNAGADAYNTAVGYDAGLNVTTGTANTIIGGNSGVALTTGGDNVAVGYLALSTEDTGTRNTAIGRGALQNLNYNGNGYNTAVGYEAGNDVTSGVQNTIIGGLAGDALTTGEKNIAVGYAALGTEDTGSRNVAIGNAALFSLNYDGTGYNVAIGHTAGYSITTGTLNTIVGGLAGQTITTGAKNTALGYQALTSNADGSNSTAIGYRALLTQDPASAIDMYNVAVGHDAGLSVTTGVQNTIVGGLAGDALTTGSNNVAIGNNALSTENAHGRNVAVGHNALMTQDAGADAYNVAMGYNSGKAVTTGIQNTLIGALAGDAITDGDANIVIGYDSGGVLTEGGQNTLVGDQAAGALTTGGENTYIGRRSGSNATTGSNNLSIGASSSLSSATVSNEANIFNGSVVARFQGAASAWTFVSDERDKKDIEDLELGLDFIDKLKPRKFKWDLRDSDTDKGKESSGFIAQEIKEVLDETGVDYTGIVDTNNPDQYTVAQANIIPMLVKAIQELKQEIQQLKNK